MSLMFAALKRMESPSGGSTAPVPAAAPAGRARRWLWPALAVTGSALLAGGWLWASAGPAGAQAGGNEAATIQSVASVAPAAAVTPATATAPAPSEAPIAAASTAGAQPARLTPAIVADAAASTSPARQQRNQEPATAVTPAPAPVPVPASEPAPAPAPAPEPAPAPAALVARIAEVGVTDTESASAAEARTVADLVAAIGHAIHAGDTPAAQARLAELEAQLPPRSLTLLRMQAWVAHESGDTATAMAAYRQVVARLPGDQTAVINLAILEAGNGQPESARERLRRLRAMDPGSHAVERAIGRVESMLR